MDIQTYKCAGYSELSLNLSQSLIDRAEREVMQAYITPIITDADAEDDDDVKNALMCLAALRMLQISVMATRAGAKEKTTAESYTATDAQIARQYVDTAHMYMKVLREREDAVDGEINDICGIYFINQYFYK